MSETSPIESAPTGSAPIERAPIEPAPVEPRRIEVAHRRRAPRFRAFVGTGAVLGFVLGLLIAYLAPGTTRLGNGSVIGDGTVAGFVAAALGLIGALVGGGVAVLVDRRSARDL